MTCSSVVECALWGTRVNVALYNLQLVYNSHSTTTELEQFIEHFECSMNTSAIPTLQFA